MPKIISVNNTPIRLSFVFFFLSERIPIRLYINTWNPDHVS